MFNDNFSVANLAKRRCAEAARAREECYRRETGGSNDTENCYAEELFEKRCLSFHCCPREAKAYYGTPNGIMGKADCSTWAEAFAFSVDDGKNTPEVISKHTEVKERIDDSTLKSRCKTFFVLRGCEDVVNEDYIKL